MAYVRKDPLFPPQMSPLLPNYLRTLRMRWGLTQPELSGLLGISESALSKFETQALEPTKNLILGTEVIFGQAAREAFPAICAQTERDVMRRAVAFSARLEERHDHASTQKRKLLAEMIKRREVNNSHL